MLKLNKNSFIILLIFLLGLILRLMSVNQSLWLDEAISVEAVKNNTLINLITRFMRADFNPPLFNAILYFWLKIFPATEFFIRLPSVIFGLAACYFTYKIGELFDKKIAILSLILLITSPLHIYYSQEARMYSLATFLVAGSMYYFIKFTISREARFRFAGHYSLFTILTLYSHYLAWLILPVQWLFFILSKSWVQKKLFLNYLITQLLITISMIPLLPLLLIQLGIGRKAASENIVWHDVVGELSLKNLALLPIKFIIGRTSFDNKLLYGSIALFLIAFFAFLLGKARTNFFFSTSEVSEDFTSEVSLRQGYKGRFTRLIWLWLVGPIVLGILISIKIPVFSYFRFLFCLPAFYLLLAKGVYNFRRPKPIIILLIVINLFFSQRYLLNQNYHRENWQEAVKVLHLKNNQHNQVLLFQNVNAPFVFYDQGQSRITYSQQKELLSNENVLWYIPYAQPIFDPLDTVRNFLNKSGFSRTYEEHFRGVTLEKYEKVMVFKYN